MAEWTRMPMATRSEAERDIVDTHDSIDEMIAKFIDEAPEAQARKVLEEVLADFDRIDPEFSPAVRAYLFKMAARHRAVAELRFAAKRSARG